MGSVAKQLWPGRQTLAGLAGSCQEVGQNGTCLVQVHKPGLLARSHAGVGRGHGAVWPCVLAREQGTIRSMKPVKQEQSDLTCGFVGVRDRSRGYTSKGDKIRPRVLGPRREDGSGEARSSIVAFCIFMKRAVNMRANSLGNRVDSMTVACTDTGMGLGMPAVTEGMGKAVGGVICTKGAWWLDLASFEAHPQSMAAQVVRNVFGPQSTYGLLKDASARALQLVEPLQRGTASRALGENAVLIYPHSLLFHLQLEGVNRLVSDCGLPIFGGLTWKHVLDPVGPKMG